MSWIDLTREGLTVGRDLRNPMPRRPWMPPVHPNMPCFYDFEWSRKLMEEVVAALKGLRPPAPTDYTAAEVDAWQQAVSGPASTPSEALSDYGAAQIDAWRGAVGGHDAPALEPYRYRSMRPVAVYPRQYLLPNV